MLSFIVTVRRFLKALYHAGREEEFQALAFITIVLLISGSFLPISLFYRIGHDL